jgi:hypothetical protein
VVCGIHLFGISVPILVWRFSVLVYMLYVLDGDCVHLYSMLSSTDSLDNRRNTMIFKGPIYTYTPYTYAHIYIYIPDIYVQEQEGRTSREHTCTCYRFICENEYGLYIIWDF